MSFNVNCSECCFCSCDDDGNYFCCHPRMVLAAGGFWPIENIEQNIDCDWFEEYK